jgi:hypothetical protein
MHNSRLAVRAISRPPLASAVSIIARNWIIRKAIALALRQATRFVDDLGFGLVAKLRNLRPRGAAGRDIDLILCKSDFDSG